MKVCKVCGKITKYSDRCKSCSNKQRAWRKPNFCINCNKSIQYVSTRCNMCKSKKSLNGNYKDGRTKKDRFCYDCGKQLNHYHAKRCKSCGAIYRNLIYGNAMKGVRRFGISNPNYKNGSSALNLLIRGLDEYKFWRNMVFSRDYYTCQECHIKTNNIEAHHKKEFIIILNEFLKEYSQFSPVEDKETLIRLAITYKDFWDINNGLTLCDKCHQKTQVLRR